METAPIDEIYCDVASCSFFFSLRLSIKYRKFRRIGKDKEFYCLFSEKDEIISIDQFTAVTEDKVTKSDWSRNPLFTFPLLDSDSNLDCLNHQKPLILFLVLQKND